MIKINKEWLQSKGFVAKQEERVYVRGDVGYEFGFTCRAVVKCKFGWILLKEIQYTHEMDDLHYILTGEKLIN
jgi:hypothetical protein